MSTSKRISKVNQLIQKELGQIIFREVDFPESVLVTLTRVEVSANLQEAGVFISVMPEDKFSIVFAILNKLVYFLQQKLNKRLKMRPLPRIIFVEERKTSEAGRVEELLEKIRNPKSEARNKFQ